MEVFEDIKLEKIICNKFDSIDEMTNDSSRYVCLNVNIRSLKKHWDEFTMYIKLIEQKMQILLILITEVNLKDYETNLFNVFGYHKFFSLRKHKEGGGIMLLTNKRLEFNIIDNTYNNFESISGNIKFMGKMIKVMGIYRPPNVSIKNF